MKITEYMKEHLLFLDGAMGTLLQKAGLKPGEAPCDWNLTHPEEVKKVHRAYFDAGSDLVCTDTFGADLMHYDRKTLEKIICSAVGNARDAAKECGGKSPKWVALDVAPLGRLLRPLGDLDFEEAVSVFRQSIEFGACAGADLIMIETMTDLGEARAALLAAKEACELPVFVSCAFEKEGRLMTGADPETVCNVLGHLGADAVGVNCSYGPDTLLPVIRQYIEYSPVPVLFKPNAGLPREENGNTVFDVTPELFVAGMLPAVKMGIAAAGGCCGTSPAHIAALTQAAAGCERGVKVCHHFAAASSATRTVRFGDRPVLIGERINPTGKKRFRQALQEKDLPFILNEGLKQADRGAQMLDVNAGAPGVDEKTMLPLIVRELQTVTDLPLQPDSTDPVAMENALRVCNGRALINSVNGTGESLKNVLPLAKKYGSMVVALTLDEQGIPGTAEGRLRIAERILAEAKRCGLEKEDLIFDPLTLSVSNDPDAARVTLEAVRLIRERLQCNVSLGVSNISFGLPCRDGVNSVFFTLALQYGITAAIMNPESEEMMNAYRSFLLLQGRDEGCRDYLDFAASRTVLPAAAAVKAAPVTANVPEAVGELGRSVLRGMKAEAVELVRTMLGAGREPLEIIQQELVPALDVAGKEYEAKRFFLPQLLMSADTVSACFTLLSSSEEQKENENTDTVVLATVRGDIHDIGKNIVGMLLGNYGFRVIDLGKNVPGEEVLRAVKEHKARLCGLSALMTTTVPAMEETVRLLKEKAPDCRVVVGGAVLTEDYAAKIGADCYAADAMATVRYAEKVYRE